MIIKAIFFITMMLHSNAFASDSVRNCMLTTVQKEFGPTIVLGEVLELQKIEQKYLMPVIVGGKKQLLPFGERNSAWLEFKSIYRLGDCVVYFESDRESWANLSGRRGYVLIRNGKAIDAFIYARS
jgi:hypothetical protein